MFRRLMILGLVLGSGSAFAQSRVDIFKWRDNGVFDLQVTVDGARNVNFNGELTQQPQNCKTPEECDVTVTKERYTAHVHSYPGFVSVIVTRSGDELGKLFLLERTKSTSFTQMNEAPILGQALEMSTDLSYALKRFAELKKLNNKEPSLAFRAMVAYFEGSPTKKLDNFADDVENGAEVVRAVPRPGGNVTEGTATADVKPLPQRRNLPQEQQVDQFGNPLDLSAGRRADNRDPSFQYPGEVAAVPPGEIRPRRPRVQRQEWPEQRFDQRYDQPPRYEQPRNEQPRDQIGGFFGGLFGGGAPRPPRAVQAEPRYNQPAPQQPQQPRYAPQNNEVPAWANQPQRTRRPPVSDRERYLNGQGGLY